MRRISTKQKKELYSLSSLLFHLIIFIGLLLSLEAGSDATNSDKTENAKTKEESTLQGLFVSVKQ